MSIYYPMFYYQICDYIHIHTSQPHTNIFYNYHNHYYILSIEYGWLFVWWWFLKNYKELRIISVFWNCTIELSRTSYMRRNPFKIPFPSVPVSWQTKLLPSPSCWRLTRLRMRSPTPSTSSSCPTTGMESIPIVAFSMYHFNYEYLFSDYWIQLVQIRTFNKF